MSKREQEEFNKRGRSEWLELIKEWIHSEVDREMVERAYLDGITFERVAEEFDLSVNHCEKRIKTAIKQLFEHVK